VIDQRRLLKVILFDSAFLPLTHFFTPTFLFRFIESPVVDLQRKRTG
jgi:hypothetical protein